MAPPSRRLQRLVILLVLCSCLVHGISAANVEITNYNQYGGKGGGCATMSGYKCLDATYAGYSCKSGFTCQRQNEWYWQCLKGSTVVAANPTTTTTSGTVTTVIIPRDIPTTVAVIPPPDGNLNVIIPGATSVTSVPVTTVAPPKVIAAYGQCGGMGGDCNSQADYKCDDAAYAGYTCATGFSCKRQDNWYWQCKV